MFEDQSHGSDSYFGVRVEQVTQQISGDIIIRNLSQGLSQTVFVPGADLSNLAYGHRTFASAGVGSQWGACYCFVHNHTIGPNVVGSLRTYGNWVSKEVLLSNRNSLVFDSNRLWWVIEPSVGVGWRPNWDASANTQQFPTTSKLSNVVSAKVPVNDSMFVHV
jgi:hypothetical protein